MSRERFRQEAVLQGWIAPWSDELGNERLVDMADLLTAAVFGEEVE